MKILLVSTQDYIHHPVPSRHHYIFEELATRHEVHVPHFHVSDGPERATRLHVHEATLFPFKSPVLHYTANAPYHAAVMKRIIRENEIDVVVAAHVLAGTAAIRAAKRAEIPVLFDLKDWFPDSAAAYYKNPYLKKLVHDTVWAVTSHNLRNSDHITTVSPSLARQLGQYGFEAEVITNGVNTEIFRPMDGSGTRRRLGIPEDDYVIGFAGSVERWYAVDNLVRVLPELRARYGGVHLLIVGGSLFTDYLEEIKALVKKLGMEEHVTFTGTVEHAALPELIAAMDLCTIPLSPPQWANIALPNKFFEYSACGKPILSRPIPDMEAIGGEHLSIYRDEAEFIENVGARIQERGTLTIDAEQFSWKKRAAEMEAVLESLI
ncbi:glycosyltransferase [Methanofollis formosanus]|uniref:Glycosyltransferase n=1 Tax=Methanofollis formosanus TaxID=299308 RepID=A0A8G1A296_9EURY|nr:glycosyltransferase family 4 protein [Methanofollis formosanus]QYZ79240.1 glycosyltransferase [Methanofollis formosanus]